MADIVATANNLSETHSDSSAEEVLRSAVSVFGASFAVVSSFGAESAVLLHIASKIDKNLPILFIDTGKHFAETLAYRDALIEQLDLKNVITVQPEKNDILGNDEDGTLFAHDPDHCCFIRKVIPLDKVVSGYDAWATGRKRYQNENRQALSHFELADGKIKVNPLAHWSHGDVERYLKDHNLPAHTLVKLGYPSIGCAPCTKTVSAGAPARAGRWQGSIKSECGIHLSADKQFKMPLAS